MLYVLSHMRSIVLESLDDFQQYEVAWEGLRQECKAPIFSSYDLVYLWLDIFRATVKPYVVLIEDNGELIGVAPMCTSYRRVMGLPIKSISMVGQIPGLAFFGSYSVFAKHDDPATIREMLSCLKQSKWNVLSLFQMEMNNSTLGFMDGIRKEWVIEPSENVDINRTYVFPLEGDIAANFGKNARQKMNRIRRKLESENRIDYRKVESVEDAERAMRLYIHQHKERWEPKGGSIFNKPINRELLVEMGKLAIGTGKGDISELLIDGEVAGQLLCFFDGDVSRGIRVGMTDKFRDFSPGMLVITLTMEDHRKRGLKAMDLLHGNAEYKINMTNNERVLGSAKVCKGTMRMMSFARSFPTMKLVEDRLGLHKRMVR
jgi:hypothetical protein